MSLRFVATSWEKWRWKEPREGRGEEEEEASFIHDGFSMRFTGRMRGREGRRESRGKLAGGEAKRGRIECGKEYHSP